MLPRRVIILACAVTLVSAFFSFYIHDRPRVDAKAYDRIGWNLARGLGYVEAESLVVTPEKDDAIVRVGPGYEFFLAGVYSFAGHRYWVVWLLHALLRGASVIFIYFIAEMLFASLNVSFLAAFFFGFSPDLVVINGFLLTETLFLFLVIVSVHETLRYISRPTGISAFVVGVSWALAILVRPVALLAFLVVFGFLIWRHAWRDILLMLITPLILIGSWSAYATHRYGSFVLTTTAGGYDLWVGNNEQATGGFEKTPEIQALRDITHSIEIEKISRKKYFEFLFGHPFKFIELQFRKLSIYFDVLRPGGTWVGLYGHKWFLIFIILTSLLWNMLFFVGGLGGLWILACKQKDIATRSFIAIALLAPLGVIPIIVETRYRYPFFPFLAIGAAFFIMQRPINFKILGRVILVLGFFAAYDLWSNWGSLIQKLQSVLNI